MGCHKQVNYLWLSPMKRRQKRYVQHACSKRKEEDASVVQRITLEDLYSEMKKGKITELKVILKADVRGSLEAMLIL